MLYSALTFAYIGYCQRFAPTRRTRQILALSLFVHAIFTTYLVTAFEGKWQFLLFHISFGTAQIYAVYQLVLIYRRRRARSASDSAVWVFERGIFCYLMAFVCWLIDMFLCEFLNPRYPQSILPINPQFHAWWHILISMGLYNMALLALIERVDTLHGPNHCALKFTCYIIPYIQLKKRSTTRNGKIYSTFQ